MFAQRSASAKVPLHKSFVDNSHTRRAIPIAFLEVAALHDGNAHVRQVTRTSQKRIDLHVLTRTRIVPFDFDAAARASHEADRRFVHQARRLHSRKGGNSLRQLSPK